MKHNAKDLAQWEKIFADVPAAWKTAPPTQHMRDCLAFFQREKVKTVLDVGCGIGIWAHYLVKAGMQVTGTDFSSNAIAFAKRWAQEEKLDTEFVCAPATENRFAGTSFDATVAAKILENLSTAEARIAVQNMQTQLRPGGVLYALFNPHFSERQLAELAKSDNPTKGITHINYTDDDIAALLSDFQIIEVKKYDDGFRGFYLRR